jgi:hypothetical protein
LFLARFAARRNPVLRSVDNLTETAGRRWLTGAVLRIGSRPRQLITVVRNLRRS